MKVGYYESWNWDRPCLNYRAETIDTTDVTHAHWGFANINSDFSISIDDKYNQLPDFLDLAAKSVVSFGGWGYSTDEATYNILRNAMKPGNVDKFVANIVDLLNSKGFDGVDIDWEYPGVS
jgi:GH18 family chitinase